MRFIGNDPNILDAFYTATADGSIAAGKPVIVTAGGITLGTQSSEFDAQAHYISAVYDTSNDKVVVAYGDPGNSNYGTAVIGTVSGSDVTFGTPVVFESDTVSGNYSITSAFDSANNKVVIAYRDGGNSNEGTAIVGTVSGTSISFGSAVVFETGETYDLTATFDDVAEKVVIAYRDVSNSQYGCIRRGCRIEAGRVGVHCQLVRIARAICKIVFCLKHFLLKAGTHKIS